MKLWNLILERLFPPKCVLCRRLLVKEETDLCGACRRELPQEIKPRPGIRYIDDWTGVCYYEGKARESVLRYKFSGRRNYAPAYGRLLAARVAGDLPGPFDLVTYVPVSKKRRKKRGYDQSELLARAVARELGLPVQKTLEKLRDNPAQSGLKDAAKRRANVLGAYRAEAELVRDKGILLIDDVITTGATLSECARVLKTAGAGTVRCAAFAAGRKKFN